jgi:hypothetical protein
MANRDDADEAESAGVEEPPMVEALSRVDDATDGERWR